MEGKIVRLNKSGQFGFITGADNVDRFFHRSAVDNRDFNELVEGQRVAFEHEKGPKGPRCKTVTVLD